MSLGYCVPCAYPRICSNCASACFHILFIPSAYACGYPRICSNCAAACFHILGFIAGEHRDRGDPVIIKSRISAWHNLLDCFAALAMTEVLLFLVFSDHPAAARRPSIEGNLFFPLWAAGHFTILRVSHCHHCPCVIEQSFQYEFRY